MDIGACILRALVVAFGVALGTTLGAALMLGLGVLITLALGGVVLITLAEAVGALIGIFFVVYAVDVALLIIQCVAQATAAAPQAGNNQTNQGLLKDPCHVCSRLQPYLIAAGIVIGLKLLHWP